MRKSKHAPKSERTPKPKKKRRAYIPNPSGQGGFAARELRFPDGRTVRSLGLFAKQCGIAQTYVSRIFRGERQPSVHVFARMTAALGVSMEALYAWMYGGGGGAGRKSMVPSGSPVMRRIRARAMPKPIAVTSDPEPEPAPDPQHERALPA